MPQYYLSKHTVSIESGTRKVLIYLSRPTIPDKRPVIIVLHEWWGLNDHIRAIADRYANIGYVAAAPDLYAGRVAKDRTEAASMAQSVTPELSTQILKSVLDYILIREFTNQFKIGLHGFCFGGSHALNFLCESKKIAAGVIFYASVLPPKEKLANLNSPLLIVYGDKDQAVKPEQARELETTLKELKKNIRLEMYEGAGHAFANETGQNYNEEAAKKAWQETEKFFGTYLPIPKAK